MAKGESCTVGWTRGLRSGRWVARIVVVILAVAVTAGCADESKLRRKIVGKWIETDGKIKMELFKDGTITLVVQAGPFEGISNAGKYTFIDKDRVKVEWSGGGAWVAEVSISGDEMTWTRVDGVVLKFRREAR
jgi:hypothetical protein